MSGDLLLQPEKPSERSTSPPEQNLYHYTNQTGLLRLTESLEIRATKIQYFNDGLELNLGLGVAREQLQQMRKDEESLHGPLLSRLLDSIDQVRTINRYVASFSRAGDSLSLWRAYCTFGDGFSIGLDKAALESLIQSRGWRIVSCIYDAGEQQRRIRRLISRTLEDATSQKAAGTAAEWKFAERLADMALEIKNPSFLDEREVRIISPTISEEAPEVTYRAGKYTLCPFFALRLAADPTKFPIERVTIGPTPYPDLSIQATAALLRQRGLNQASVFQSRTSLRLW